MSASKTTLFLTAGLLVTLWMPLIINHSGLLPKATVFGVEPEVEQQETSWYDGSAQIAFEELLMKNSVARTYFLRVRNQYQYSLFGKINAPQIYQYGDQYFRFYSPGFNESQNFVGLDSIQHSVKKLRELQDFVGKDIPIITLIAPNKARYCASILPEKQKTSSLNTNYTQLLKALEKEKLHCIDFNQYFVQHPSIIPAIFANGGIHWTHYAATVAMDSLVRSISEIKHKNYDRFTYQPVWNNGFNVDDLDLALMRNLFTKPKDENCRGVKITPIKKDGKIKALIIGDSFFLAIQNSGVRKAIFTDDSDYLYYFNRKYDADYKEHPVNYLGIRQQLKEVDCIIILTDIINLEKFGFGFQQEMTKTSL